MRWLITGGVGFIGSNLVAHILANEPDRHEIIVFDNLSESNIDNFRAVRNVPVVSTIQPGEPVWRDVLGSVSLFLGDILDNEAIIKASQGADVIIHLAANTGVPRSVADPRHDCETNVTGTLNCLEAARRNGVTRFIFASSGAPAGLCEPPITEDIAPRPASPYGASKLAGEAYCCAYANTFGIDAVALRFSNVYGPYSWNKGSVVASFLRQAYAGRPIVINGDGRQTRDFVFVEDLVEAIVLSAKSKGLGGEIFQIATGVETSVLDLVDRLTRKGVGHGPNGLEVEYGTRGPADVLRNYADASRAREILGWTPRHKLDAGLDITIAWFATVASRCQEMAPGR